MGGLRAALNALCLWCAMFEGPGSFPCADCSLSPTGPIPALLLLSGSEWGSAAVS